MRICSVRCAIVGFGLAAGVAGLAGPAFAFDGTRTPPSDTVALTPMEAFRSGAKALRVGEKAKAVSSLQYAAEKGHALAQWKLGRMYAEGDGVKRNDLKAFHYFRKLASDNADIAPNGPRARFVSNAFVAVGSYYETGIANTKIKPNPDHAREMYAYAASYFGDADAQYRLARLYLDGKHSRRDARQAARWLSLAAHKGQHQAQAVLGHMLFDGMDGLPRQAARGLMWLTLAREGAAGAEDGWIV
jgi:TPR repeat protein